MPASKYRPEMAQQVRKLALLGLTDEQMADVLDVCRDTFRAWDKAHPEFRQARMDGKVIADAEVAAKLYDRATGYEYEEEQSALGRDGEVRSRPVKRHMPADVQAARWWLKNRHSDKWKDDQTVRHGASKDLLEQLINAIGDGE